VSITRFSLASIFCTISVLAACGGGSSTTTSGGGGGGGGAPGSPSLVTVSAGANASGINISVVSPQSTPTPNAKFLGVNLAQGATVTGDTVSRGQGNATVTMFGPGLSSSMKVSITGPGDITVGTLTAVTAQDGTPGVQFPITLTNGSALGARTVLLQDAKNDVTTFSGGLEVVP